jgi:hypothetical protein
MSFFFFYKIREQEDRTGLVWGGGWGAEGWRAGSSGRGRR